MLATFAVLVGLLAPGGNATLEVSVTPRNATVQVDGKTQKINLGGKISVSPGSHRVSASAPGYSSESQTVNTAAGKTSKVKLSLSKAAASKSPISTKKPTTVAPVAKRPAAKRPASKRPVAKRPVAKRPVSKRPVAKRPVAAKRPIGNKPVGAKRPAVAKKPATGVATRPKTAARPNNNRPVSGGGNVNGATPVAAERRPMSTKPFAVLSWIVGGVAITGGVLAGMEAQDYADQFNDSVRRREKQGFKTDAENWALGSNVLYGVGATAVVVGALLWALDPADSYGASVAPLPGGGAYVGFGGSF